MQSRTYQFARGERVIVRDSRGDMLYSGEVVRSIQTDGKRQVAITYIDRGYRRTTYCYPQYVEKVS